MIKRTLYFGNPAYLSMKDRQLVVKLPEVENNKTLPTTFKKESITTIPIEDIGVVVIDHKQITFTSGLMDALLQNNAAVITCNDQHLPAGLMMPLNMNTLQEERFEIQIQASQPLKKQLWQQTVSAKIINQAKILQQTGVNTENMLRWADKVKSGDPENMEGRAAAYYWKNLFLPHISDFHREREGKDPNPLLNYGYAILRGIVARGLVASGLLPTLGIHHTNKYNAYCLADDIMEPYRPFVDNVVFNIIRSGKKPDISQTAIKSEMLSIPTLDIVIDEQRSPLMVGMQRTTASLVKCYTGELRKINYPTV